MSKPSFDQLDNDAARRALDYYLNPEPESASGGEDMQLVVARHDLTAEIAAQQADWLLRSASSSAWEAAQRMRDKAQDQMLTVMHLLNMGRAMLEHSQRLAAKHDQESVPGAGSRKE
ncbi:MAG: hypothetical protein LBJ37_26115 [Paucimonas sp.]|jgi:hypothetical protein|nr:hypothetical protein [Paucimonas sp.]